MSGKPGAVSVGILEVESGGSSVRDGDAETPKATLCGREIAGGEHEHVSGSMVWARAPEGSLQHENRVADSQPQGLDLVLVLDPSNFHRTEDPLIEITGGQAIPHAKGEVVDSGHGPRG
jgi:hypothetical protein